MELTFPVLPVTKCIVILSQMLSYIHKIADGDLMRVVDLGLVAVVFSEYNQAEMQFFFGGLEVAGKGVAEHDGFGIVDGTALFGFGLPDAFGGRDGGGHGINERVVDVGEPDGLGPGNFCNCWRLIHDGIIPDWSLVHLTIRIILRFCGKQDIIRLISL